jgi:FemAB-related protein (PEP-CTERM system-associated)
MMPASLAHARDAIDVTAEASESEWDRFVADHPGASAYHAFRWRHVFERAFGHETRYLAAREQGAIVGVLPLVLFDSRLFGRFAVSLPFVNYGGICARDADVADRLVEAAAALGTERRLSHIELRHLARQLPRLPVRQHKVTMRLQLERDPARAWERIDRKTRNHIRKAQKSDLVARCGGAELLERFYGVFATNMRDLGTPVYAIRFFREILASFPDQARVFLVDRGAETIAAGIGLRHRDGIEVPWASSLRAFRPLCGNYLLYWRILEYAIESGLGMLDFGRSTPNEGTFVFKEQWRAAPEPLHWEYVLLARAGLPDLTPTNSRFKAAIETWKRLPVGVTKVIGPHIIRSIP